MPRRDAIVVAMHGSRLKCRAPVNAAVLDRDLVRLDRVARYLITVVLSSSDSVQAIEWPSPPLGLCHDLERAALRTNVPAGLGCR